MKQLELKLDEYWTFKTPPHMIVQVIDGVRSIHPLQRTRGGRWKFAYAVDREDGMGGRANMASHLDKMNDRIDELYNSWVVKEVMLGE